MYLDIDQLVNEAVKEGRFGAQLVNVKVVVCGNCKKVL